MRAILFCVLVSIFSVSFTGPTAAYGASTTTTLVPTSTTILIEPGVVVSIVPPPSEPLPAKDFLSQVLETVKSLGGLSMMGKLSSLVLLLIASMKVTILNQWVWQRLGEAQVWMAPVLGLIAGLLGLGKHDLPSITAYLAAGAGAILLHELLDSLKAIPGLGKYYVMAIDFVSKLLGAKTGTAA